MSDGVVKTEKSAVRGVHFAPLRSREEQDLHSGNINIEQYLERAQKVADSGVYRSMLDKIEDQRLDRVAKFIRVLSLSGGFLLAAAYLGAGVFISKAYSDTPVAYLSAVTGAAVGTLSILFAVFRKR
ncbi:hypothetical protein [Umezawaea sp. Da 62-37]|uniref:hypothetical protein n=1 Tax=Umezawaea sp. Da 62-37 TaxID=3075927 RepID=UPI0028F70B5B|nr:hypothetical protein [Umezawaea sp. Da 62-37]WNV90046.1 hypothetical protein RM788_17630 [Umezawaea sp. Da 62-37]